MITSLVISNDGNKFTKTWFWNKFIYKINLDLEEKCYNNIGKKI